MVLELEDAPVTPAEAQLHDRVAAVLDGAPHILDSIRNYAGCQVRRRRSPLLPKFA